VEMAETLSEIVTIGSSLRSTADKQSLTRTDGEDTEPVDRGDDSLDNGSTAPSFNG
jgi:hypothetical protein